jgi:hypothetical protein
MQKTIMTKRQHQYLQKTTQETKNRTYANIREAHKVLLWQMRRMYVYNITIQANAGMCNEKKNSVALAQKQIIPTKRSPHVGEVHANFCG